MSRRDHKKRRVTFDNAKRSLPFSISRIPYNTLKIFEDRRQWHPEGSFAPARSFSQTRHRLRQTNLNKQIVSKKYRKNIWDTPVSRIGFVRPNKVLICVRRNQRKQVLHALRKTGKVGQRKPRYNWYSSISCRR